MNAKQVGALLLLSALWGGSFLFIRIASPVLGPVLLIELRVLIAGVALLFYMLMTRSSLDLRARWKYYLVIGIINSAIPFTLIATAELYLTAGLAATLNANRTIRIEPPLIITESQINLMIDTLESILVDLKSKGKWRKSKKKDKKKKAN